MTKLISELEEINPTAANSLREGLEETLTLHRMRVPEQLRKSLNTTNCIESILAQVQQYTQRVDRWRNGAQIQRWVAAGLWEVEPRLRKVRGVRHMLLLKDRIKEELKRARKEKYLAEEQELVQVGV